MVDVQADKIHLISAWKHGAERCCTGGMLLPVRPVKALGAGQDKGSCCPANNDEAGAVQHGLLLAAPALTDMAVCGGEHPVRLSWGMDGQISVMAIE